MTFIERFATKRVRWAMLLMPIALALSVGIAALFFSPIIYNAVKAHRYHRDECRILRIDDRNARVFCYVMLQSWSNPNVTGRVEVDKWVDGRPCDYELNTNVTCWTKNNWWTPNVKEPIRLFRYPQDFATTIVFTVGIFIMFGIMAMMGPLAGAAALVDSCVGQEDQTVVDEEAPILTIDEPAQDEVEPAENVIDDGSMALVEMATHILKTKTL